MPNKDHERYFDTYPQRKNVKKTPMGLSYRIAKASVVTEAMPSL